MKKLLPILLCAALLAGCGSSASSAASSAAESTAASESVAESTAESTIGGADGETDIVGYKGDVTNDQADCGLVFVAQAKPGKATDVESELQAYKDSLSANDLYAEFADKVALAKDARIVTNGDYVAIVIAGISNPDYSAIDTALETALNF